MKIEKIKSEAIIAEFIGSFSLTFAILVAAQGLVPGISISVIAGLTVTLFVLLVGKVSGAHLNPAVTVAMHTIKKIDTTNAVAFVVSQLSGALLALVSMSLYFDGVIFELPIIGTWAIFWAEFLGATIFGFGFAAAIYHKLTILESATALGLSYFLGITIASVASPGIINPAVALGLGIASLPFIMGPFIGAIFGANLYRLLEPVEEVAKRKAHKKATKSKKSK